MEILEEKILAKQIFKKYSVNPRNWNFIISTNSIRDGFFDARVTNSDDSWQLKIDSIYKPSPIITGTKLDIDPIKINKTLDEDIIPFGYRKIDPPVFMNMFRKISDEHEMLSKKNTDYINRELNFMLNSMEPTVPTKGTDYLYGPFLYTSKNLIGKSTYHDIISEKLTSNIKKKIKERYPGYG
ncbi:MAG TPA: hypothetical protein VJP58_03135 [Candidatus Nitrosocosmicus sp.]|nr:hypothetical protein [Candidatus Nitrosocosmicus sp.]